jgi:hypothetical protein
MVCAQEGMKRQEASKRETQSRNIEAQGGGQAKTEPDDDNN